MAQAETFYKKVYIWSHIPPFTKITYIPSFPLPHWSSFSELLISVSWAAVLILPQIKLHSQLPPRAIILVNTTKVYLPSIPNIRTYQNPVSYLNVNKIDIKHILSMKHPTRPHYCQLSGVTVILAALNPAAGLYPPLPHPSLLLLIILHLFPKHIRAIFKICLLLNSAYTFKSRKWLGKPWIFTSKFKESVHTKRSHFCWLKLRLEKYVFF